MMRSDEELDAQRNLPKRNRLMLIVQLPPSLSMEEGQKRRFEISRYLDQYFEQSGWKEENGFRGVIASKWTRPKSEG